MNCVFCDEPIEGETPVHVTNGFGQDDGEAHDGCYSDAGERAEQRLISNFYGSSSPQTERERGIEANEQKRKLG